MTMGDDQRQGGAPASVQDRGPPRADGAPPDEWRLLQALGDGIYGVDRQGRCTFVNRTALAMLGYDAPGELLGRTMHDLIHHTRPDGSSYPVEACPLLGTLRT